MNTVSLLLAWRYVHGKYTEQSINSMISVCLIGIFIGTFSLTLVLSIMQGFEHVTHEKFRGIHAPITIQSAGDSLDIQALATLFKKEFPEIAAYSPADTRQVIIQAPNTEHSFTVITLKGVIPHKEFALQVLAKKFVTASHNSFIDALRNNRLILGKKLAQELHVTPGDSITILYPREEQIRKQQLALDRAPAYVGGIFDAGIDEVDSSLALCSLNFLQTLFSDSEPTHIGLTLKPGYDEEKAIARLRTRSKLDVFSWKDLYPALVAALRLEQYALFLILALILLVASMNIISLLFMQITHKRGDIAILKTMGMSDRSIKTIFISIGLGISLIGSCCGLVAAYIVGSLLERYPLITLPDVYYVSHLPIHMTGSIVGFVLLLTLLISLLATWLPLSRIATITIAKILRMEA